MSVSRLLGAALLLIALFVVIAPAFVDGVLAFTDETDTTAVEPEQAGDDVVIPAVEAPEPEEEEDEAPWTQRFLAPATLVLGVISVVGVVAYYGLRIGGRFRVVD